MERLIKSQPAGNYQEIVRPGTMRFLDFGRLRLGAGQRHSYSTEDREAVLDILSGIASFTVETAAGKKEVFHKAGGRVNVFSAPPVMLYIPPHSKCQIKSESAGLDIGIFSAPSQSATPPALLEGPAIVKREVGRDNWRRTVYTALGEDVPAERLLAGETLNPPGNWSSYPPHKHDRSNPPHEAVLEEIYFFRVKPAGGYGFIWTYTAPGRS